MNCEFQYTFMTFLDRTHIFVSKKLYNEIKFCFFILAKVQN